ncbi:family 16 glycosylhydrolase [Algibacter lectus]|uniref:Agarase n=1 Tax=Algibacter lectus TaxID=221126 RepID=A0A4R8MFT7_9FLAO|nr:family 16 glycosylhydrolase [Algibacter lectus]MWW25261.1 family 16 glycosylhydrolase [Algibacter lectus]TDY64324.1 agarase [Algibacter lectus]
MKHISYIILVLCVFAFSCEKANSLLKEVEEQEQTDIEDLGYETEDKYMLPEQLPIPNEGKFWKYQDKFSNEFSSDKSSAEFTTNWQDKFFNGWRGPDKTRYTPSRSAISNGELIYEAAIINGTVETGCISSKEMVKYPLYMEVRAKISNSPLACAVWMLSEDSTQEIDNLEAYGDVTNDYFSKRLHLSHHVFIRSPFQDYQPTGAETWYADGENTVWSQDYHRYGVLWWGPKDLRYFVDGKEVRRTPENQIDPENYTNSTGLNKPMYLILSQAAQGWRESNGIDYLTDPGVTNPERTRNYFDYIRVFKPE